MATDAFLLDRIRNIMESKKAIWIEKRMFGGDCFMVDDKMCFGTYKGGIMARIDPKYVDALIQRDGAEQMINGGRPMKGYLFISPDGYDQEKDLQFWIEKCLEFNPLAKSSKK